MSAPISQQLEDLLNPLPKFVDPEDDQDEETKAKVVAKFDEGNEEEQLPAGLRKRTTALLADTDRRYVGKATSRKELRREIDGSGDDDDEEEGGEENRELDEEEVDMGEEDEGGEEDEEESDEHDDIAASADDDNDEDEQISQMKTLVSKLKCADITLPAEMDFHKLTEGMDDLGESDENGMEESEQEDGEDEEEVEDDDDEDDSDEDEDDKEDGSVDDEDIRTFSSEKVDEEVAKGKAVKSQLALWDQLLEGRIRMQKALLIANQLPQPQTFPEFKSRGGAEYSRALKNSHKALKALQRSLLELQDLLLHQHPDTRALALGKSLASCSKDEEVPSEEEGEEEIEEEDDEEKPAKSAPPKRKLDMAEYPDFMAKRFAAFLPYRDATLQKWYDKTRLTMGKANKGFGAFERSILTQVEQVLMDKERLLRRTQTRRSEYRVLGKPEPDLTAPHPSDGSTEGEAAELAVKANTHLKDLDEEIFDDDDFYHQLLRELIERKTNAADPNDQVAMGRQWLAIQKLRSKIKRKVDTKASKGRKVRFHIHSKLMNFMAPVDHSSMNDEARSELYRSLFGREVIH